MAQPTDQKGRSKPPTLLACIPCRMSHLKCNGAKPVCLRCADACLECLWIESRRGYRDNRKNAMSSRLHTSQPLFHSDPLRAIKPGSTLAIHPSTGPGQRPPHPADLSASFSTQSAPELQKPQHDVLPSQGSSYSTTPYSEHRRTTQLDDGRLNEPTDLIHIYYKYFHNAHPFLIPRKLYLSCPSLLPEALKAVMRFVASNYAPNSNILALKNAALAIFSDQVMEDGFKVQGLLLLAVTFLAQHERAEGGHALQLATQIALQIGMNRNDFALTQNQTSLIIQESWRRTWWSMFIVSGIMTAVSSQEQRFELHGVYCNVPLPGECEDYEKCNTKDRPRSIAEFRNRTFSEDSYPWSSFAYAIEAMYLMGTVFNLDVDTFATTDPRVEALDASISNFPLSLPPSKREVTRPDGRIDETLLMAHLVINWACILLHRPRSTLTFIRNHYNTICTNRSDATGLPALAYASHTSKTIRAADALISLASVPQPLSYRTPILMCGITVAATVHLPAYTLADQPDTATAVRERLQLGISALNTIAETWPRANIAKSQVASFAREVLTQPHASAAVNTPGTVSEYEKQQSLDETSMSQLDFGLDFVDNAWVCSIIEMGREGEASPEASAGS